MRSLASSISGSFRNPKQKSNVVVHGGEFHFRRRCSDFRQPFGSSFVFTTDCQRTIDLEKKPLGLFTTVEASSSVKLDVSYHDLLSNTEKDNIDEHLGRLYIDCWHDDILRLRPIVAEKPGLASILMIPCTNFVAALRRLPARFLRKSSTIWYPNACIERRVRQTI